MSVATELTRIKDAKEGMKTALFSKGVTVDDAATLDAYPSKIYEIPTAGSAGELDLTGTGWETEKVFPVKISRTIDLSGDLSYTRKKFKEWNPATTDAFQYFQLDTKLIYAPKIDMQNVTNMDGCFSNCQEMVAVPHLNTSKVTAMNNCFRSCQKLIEVPLLDTSSVTNMENCFYDCTELVTIPDLNVSKVTDMSDCFSECKNLESVPALDTSSVTDMSYCFNRCTNLFAVYGLDTRSMKTMGRIFDRCTSLKYVELTGGMPSSCNCSSAFANITGSGVLALHTGNGISRSSYDPIINVLPQNWTVQIINDL